MKNKYPRYFISRAKNFIPAEGDNFLYYKAESQSRIFRMIEGKWVEFQHNKDSYNALSNTAVFNEIPESELALLI